ncbi:hypothetical protein HAX54_035076 [Datura stramonium]|uniref:Uncharacterized protein n=1 Tax=Datura stramonium TaxID=4076 RepID=A0ABS8SF09_DATST|nr:hypothetical protein [Datura stramonium]
MKLSRVPPFISRVGQSFATQDGLGTSMLKQAQSMLSCIWTSTSRKEQKRDWLNWEEGLGRSENEHAEVDRFTGHSQVDGSIGLAAHQPHLPGMATVFEPATRSTFASVTTSSLAPELLVAPEKDIMNWIKKVPHSGNNIATSNAPSTCKTCTSNPIWCM